MTHLVAISGSTDETDDRSACVPLHSVRLVTKGLPGWGGQ
jgi:hypothetical protein